MRAMTIERTQIDDINAIKTWRYLRVATIAMVLGLTVSILYEFHKVDGACLQRSISAYYYTPVRAFFVGTLVSIGLSLFSLRGSTDLEDVFLNLAGMFAPVVALVPTPGRGDCASVLGTDQDRNVNIGNNFTALLVVVGSGLAVLLALELLGRSKGRAGSSRTAKVGYVLAVALCLGAWIVFVRDRDRFTEGAHFTAAIAMFACIAVVVLIDAVGYKPKAGTIWNRYLWVFLAMVVTAVGCVVGRVLGWQHWVFGIEAGLITLFVVFWIIQTVELWRQESGIIAEHAAAGQTAPRR